MYYSKWLILPANWGRGLLWRGVTWPGYWWMSRNFSSGEKEGMLEGQQELREDQKQVHGGSGITNCPEGLEHSVYGGNWGAGLQKWTGRLRQWRMSHATLRGLEFTPWANRGFSAVGDVGLFSWQSLASGAVEWLSQESMWWDRPGWKQWGEGRGPHTGGCIWGGIQRRGGWHQGGREMVTDGTEVPNLGN